jgi:hypothetical protein
VTNGRLVDEIARALLYEGYVLYPYRPSAMKNRQRWMFGTLYPALWTAKQNGNEACSIQSECLAEGGGESRVHVTFRFLHWFASGAGGGARREAIERQGGIEDIPLTAQPEPHWREDFSFSPSPEGGQEEIHARLEVRAEPVSEGVFKISVRLTNATPMESGGRDEALLRSMASAHLVFKARDAQFVSLFDPPPALREAAGNCRNAGVWPVLAGEPGSRDTMLASPIILYDYPQVAPESPGDLCDSTEIDEMLSLRILTLADEEKREVQEGGERCRQILERTELLPPEQLLKLHGVIRSLRRVSGDQK